MIDFGVCTDKIEVKSDYPELEGKVIDVISDGVLYKGLVAGCCLDVGVTVVNTQDNDEYLFCILHSYANSYDKVQLLTEIIINRLQNNLIINVDAIEVCCDVFTHTSPSSESCPFNQ